MFIYATKTYIDFLEGQDLAYQFCVPIDAPF